MKLITLFLTCANREEAQKIADRLLDKKLAACVKITDVESNYLWKSQKHAGEEALLVIDSAEGKFTDIEAAIKAIHSYDTFALMAYPVVKASAGVEKWMAEVINVD